MSDLRNFRRILCGVNPAAALRELEERPELWDLITARQHYAGTAHADTQTVVLRGPTTLEGIFDNLEAVDFEVLNQLPATFELLVRAARAVQAREVGRVMAVKLCAGGRVKPHVDTGRYARHFARFHLVLSSSPECWFSAGGETVHMAPGEFWWFNHQVEHRVDNTRGRERIHLIVDMTAPGYTGALGVPW